MRVRRKVTLTFHVVGEADEMTPPLVAEAIEDALPKEWWDPSVGEWYLEAIEWNAKENE